VTLKIETISMVFLSAVIMGIIFIPIPIAMAGNGTTFVVDADGMAVDGDCDSGSAADYSIIQDAVDAASPGDTIIVCPGTYVEDVFIDVSNITVKGVDRPFVGDFDVAFEIIADGVKLTGFETFSEGQSCILVEGDNNKIVDNITNECEIEGGIVVSGNGNNIIANTVINDGDANGINVSGNGTNTVNGNVGDGIKVSGDDNKITGNKVSDNLRDGIEVDGNNNRIKGNTVDNNDDIGIKVSGDDNKITGNSATGNEAGMFVEGENNIIRGNKANNNDVFGFVDDGTNNTFKSNRCKNNGSGGSDPTGLCKP